MNGGVRNALVAVAGLILVELAVRVLAAPGYGHHDVVLYVDIARRILEGAAPYRDVFELNPPMAMYLMVPVAWLGSVLGVAPVAVLNVALWVGTAAVAGLLALATRPLPAVNRALLAVAWLLAASLVEIQDQGQREHLFVLALVPYLVLRWRREVLEPPHPALAGAIGLATGITACLKPHFVVVWAGVELLEVARARTPMVWAVPEVAAVVAAGAGFAGHFALWSPEARDGFFGFVVPLVRHGYAVMEAPLTHVLSVGASDLLVVLILFALLPRGPARALCLRLLAVAVVAWAMYLHQSKGWSYHLVPVRVATLLTLALALPQRLSMPEAGSPVVPATGGLLALVLAAVAWTTPQASVVPEQVARALDAHSEPGDEVSVFSCMISAHWTLPIERYQARRVVWDFPFTLLYQEGDQGPAAPPELEARYLALLEADVADAADLVLVQRSACARDGNSLASLLDRSGLRATLSQSHRRVQTADGHDVWLRRRP